MVASWSSVGRLTRVGAGLKFAWAPDDLDMVDLSFGLSVYEIYQRAQYVAKLKRNV